MDKADREVLIAAYARVYNHHRTVCLICGQPGENPAAAAPRLCAVSRVLIETLAWLLGD